VTNRRDRAALDEVARNIGQGLTNLMDDLDQYLRSDLERQELARRPLWRRYKAIKARPYVRRTRLDEIVGLDELGTSKADY
jgi:hypothetical protein